jgi:3-oxoacyl-[acyl-carrier protein] reductase
LDAQNGRLNMAGRLENRKALVTGGSRGIGAAIATAFAAEGADVAVCHDDDPEGAAAVAAAIQGYGRRALAVQCDVADDAAVERFWAEAERALGPIEILVNNAGIGGERPFEAIDLVMFDRMIAVNLRALFHFAKLAAPGMRARRWGRIVNITSQLAYKGAPGLTHYCAAKAGVVGLTRALAIELAGDGVLVNAIAPGMTETRLSEGLTDAWKARKLRDLPIRRFGVPNEIAPTAVLLASSDGDFYVGQTLSPNGGDVFL